MSLKPGKRENIGIIIIERIIVFRGGGGGGGVGAKTRNNPEKITQNPKKFPEVFIEFWGGRAIQLWWLGH